MIWGAVISAVSGFFKDKATLKQAKLDGEVKLLQSASDNVADWEQLHAKGSMSSWKDEWVLMMYSIPFILAFIPGWGQYAKAGFEIASELPEWYTTVFVTISLASFGIRATGSIKSLMGSTK